MVGFFDVQVVQLSLHSGWDSKITPVCGPLKPILMKRGILSYNEIVIQNKRDDGSSRFSFLAILVIIGRIKLNLVILPRCFYRTLQTVRNWKVISGHFI